MVILDTFELDHTLPTYSAACMLAASSVCLSLPEADPALLLGGGANPYGGGRLPNILVIFSEKPY